MAQNARPTFAEQLNGTVAVVTGAGDGIGASIAEILASRGARVIVTDLVDSAAQDTAGRIRVSGGEAFAVQHDVADHGSSSALLSAACERFGQVNLLVNNAGVARQTPFDQISDEEWDLIYNVNVKGLFFVSQIFAKAFIRQGCGRIINIASYAGKHPVPEYAHYNSSKAAVISLTQTLALELASHDITVNAVCPGIVRTSLWDSLSPEHWEEQVASIPLGRGQTPSDIGELVAFLASEGARNITGMSIGVTGGVSMW